MLQFTPEQDALFKSLLETTAFVDASPTDDTDPDNDLASLAEELKGISPWDPEFETAVNAALDAVKGVLKGDPRNEKYIDARENLEALLLVNWGLEPEEESVTASGAGQHWKDELRIPKGNGDHSGQWTFTPWKYLDILFDESNKVGQALDFGDIDAYNGKVRAKLEVAKFIIDNLKSNGLEDPNDPIVKAASESVGQLYLDAAVAANNMGLPSKTLEDAAKTSIAFGKYDWSLFNEATDIGTNDPDNDFGELLTDKPFGDTGSIEEKAKDVQVGDTAKIQGKWYKVGAVNKGDDFTQIVDDSNQVADMFDHNEAVEILPNVGTFETTEDVAAAPISTVAVIEGMGQQFPAIKVGHDSWIESNTKYTDAEIADLLNLSDAEPSLGDSLSTGTGPQKKAADLKPGDVYIDENSAGELHEVTVDYVDEDAYTGAIEVHDTEGMHNVFGPDDMVDMGSANDALPWESATDVPSGESLLVYNKKYTKIGNDQWEAPEDGETATDEEINLAWDGVTAAPPDTKPTGPSKKASDLKVGDVYLGETLNGTEEITISSIVVDSDGDIEVYDGNGALNIFEADEDIPLPAPAAEPTLKAVQDLQPGDVIDVPALGGKVTVKETKPEKQHGIDTIRVTTSEGKNAWMHPEFEVPLLAIPDPWEIKPTGPKVGDTVYVDGEPGEVIGVTQHGDIEAKYKDGSLSGPMQPSEYSTEKPLLDWEIELLEGLEDDKSPVGTMVGAQSVQVGDTVEIHGFPVLVDSVETKTDPWGGGIFTEIKSESGLTYAFEPEDKVTILKPKVTVLTEPEEPSKPATRADFLGTEAFTPAEKSAIKQYGMPLGYKTVNPFLNSNGQVFDSSIPGLRPATANEKATAQAMIKNLDSAFEKATPLDHPVTLLRRSGTEQFGSAPMQPGHVFENKAYVSTALPGGDKHGYGYETKPVAWEIELPAGAKALQGNAHENEILLPRGSKFEVVSDVTDDKGIRNLKVRVVLDQPEPEPEVAKPQEVVEGYENAAAVPVGESVLLIPDWGGGSPIKYTKVNDNEWQSIDPQTGDGQTNQDADLDAAWDTMFTQEEGKQKTVGTVEVLVPVTGKDIVPGDTLVLDGVVLKKAGGKLVPSTGVSPTVAEVKVGPKWANIVTTTGQKLWVPSNEPLTVKREVEPTVSTYPTTALQPGDTLTLDGPVLKKSAGKLIPADEAGQGKHDEKPVIATVKHGPKWTEITATSGQKLWILSGTEVSAERTPGLNVPGATPAKGGSSWKGKPAPVAPVEPIEPKAGVPKPEAFKTWLEKVKARYDANPNKAKANIEASANWPKVQSVMGEDSALAKTGLDSLLSNQYIDEGLKAEAEKIRADAAVLKPGEAAKYAKDHEAWKKAMQEHAKLLAAWQKDNPTSLKGMSGAKVFSNNQAGVAWANKNLPTPPPETHGQIQSMKGSSGYVNGQLWNNGGNVPSSVASEVKVLDKAMSPLEQDIYLFRGTNLNEFKGIGSIEDLKKAVGTTFVQHAYQPTGLGVDTHFSGSPIQIVYRAPKGTKGVWAKPIGGSFAHEREFMLGRNTKYFIHKVTQKDGKTFVEAEIIPEGQTMPDPSGQLPQPLTGKVGTYFARLQDWLQQGTMAE